MKKKDKKPKSKETPKQAMSREAPTDFYKRKVSWGFSSCDEQNWPVIDPNNINYFLDEVLPHLKALESQKWNEVFMSDKKGNHSIDADDLNKDAQDRLEELHIEAESVCVLHVTGKHCIYGYVSDAVFYLLWYDRDHGDNKTCVCRSRLKNT